MSKVSIVIPILNEEKYIEKCLDSIIKSDFNKDEMEVLLIDGGSSDNTVKIVKEYQQKYSFFKFLNNPKKIAPTAMNIGINHAKGEYIIRLDAHSSYSQDYFSKLIYWHKKLNANNVGGVLITDVKNKNPISNAIKNVLSDKFGVGSSFRSGINKIQEVDTVPFGCYKKELFNEIGFYDERLVRNQDIELNKRLKKFGGKIYIVPEIEATYYARENFKDLAKNSFENGKWNILTAYYTKTFSSLNLRHFIPMFFVLSLTIFPIFSIFSKVFLYLFLVILVSYLTLILYRSFKIKRETSLLFQFFSFLVLHFSYGFGSIYGFLWLLKKKLLGVIKIYKK